VADLAAALASITAPAHWRPPTRPHISDEVYQPRTWAISPCPALRVTGGQHRGLIGQEPPYQDIPTGRWCIGPATGSKLAGRSTSISTGGTSTITATSLLHQLRRRRRGLSPRWACCASMEIAIEAGACGRPPWRCLVKGDDQSFNNTLSIRRPAHQGILTQPSRGPWRTIPTRHGCHADQRHPCVSNGVT